VSAGKPIPSSAALPDPIAPVPQAALGPCTNTLVFLNTIPNGPETLVLPSSLSFAFWTGGLHSNTHGFPSCCRMRCIRHSFVRSVPAAQTQGYW
jgi:hypothetical protein